MYSHNLRRAREFIRRQHVREKSVRFRSTPLTTFPEGDIGVVRKVVAKRSKFIPIPNDIPMDDAPEVLACSASRLEYQQCARSIR